MLRHLLALAVLAAPAFAQLPPLQTAPIGDLKLESGETIRNCRVAYRTFGALNAEKSNAVLFPTWFSGSTEDLAGNIGAGGLVDPGRYYVIAVEALGNGLSSSPSNSQEQPRMKFPKFTIRDMVNAEHRLVSDTLGIRHLHAVMGISMGGMQTFQWAVAYPDFMTKAVPIVGSPRLAAADVLLWTAEEHAITEDGEWNNGDYQREPDLKAVGEMHSFALHTPAWLGHSVPFDKIPAFLEGMDHKPLGRMDANDWLYQLRAMISLDVAKPFGDSLAAAAKSVKAKMLVVIANEDHMVNPAPAREFAHAIDARTIELASDCGHTSPGCESGKLNPAVRAFLDGE